MNEIFTVNEKIHLIFFLSLFSETSVLKIENEKKEYKHVYT